MPDIPIPPESESREPQWLRRIWDPLGLDVHVRLPSHAAARAAFPTLTIPQDPPLTPFPYVVTRTDPDTGNHAAYPITGTNLDPDWTRPCPEVTK